jgi:ubiquinone/menaquinone biosynthesis C-methylase UbiE
MNARESDDELVSLQKTLYASHNPTRKWLHNSRREWISQALRRVGTGTGRALEIGPGSGVYVPVLKEICGEVYLADCERSYLQAIEAHYSNDPTVKLVVDDITRSNLPADHFDRVLCTEVVEHIGDSTSAFRHIARIMKRDGVLILSTPQRYSSLEVTARMALSPGLIWLTRLLYREPVMELGHINLMTETTVRTQLEFAGLTVIDQYKGGLYLPGIAELTGLPGQRIAAGLERQIRGTWLESILWTQYYLVARRGGSERPLPLP